MSSAELPVTIIKYMGSQIIICEPVQADCTSLWMTSVDRGFKLKLIFYQKFCSASDQPVCSVEHLRPDQFCRSSRVLETSGFRHVTVSCSCPSGSERVPEAAEVPVPSDRHHAVHRRPRGRKDHLPVPSPTGETSDTKPSLNLLIRNVLLVIQTF